MIAGLALLLLYYASNVNYEQHDEIVLTAELRSWIRAGAPEGHDLVTFMQGRREGFVVANRVFEVAGKSYVSQFALTNAYAHPGILFITKQGDLIWIKESGEV